MKYVFRPSHDKCQDLTEAAGTANCNFPDFPNKRLEGLFILFFADYPPLATPSTVQYIVELWQILVICIISNVDFICFYT